jgi:excisionase family DNA binding protein
MPELRIVAADTDRSTPRTAVLDDGTVALSIDEVAAVLRVNRKTVVAMIERGELAEVRYARRRWVPTHVLRELLLLDRRAGDLSGASRS